MPNSKNESFIENIKEVIQDGVSYIESLIALVQAKLAQYTFSFIVFVFLLIVSGILALAAFIFMNIALGIWLNQLFGSLLISVLILGGFYALLSVIAGGIAVRWLQNLKP